MHFGLTCDLYSLAAISICRNLRNFSAFKNARFSELTKNIACYRSVGLLVVPLMIMDPMQVASLMEDADGGSRADEEATCWMAIFEAFPFYKRPRSRSYFQ